MFHPEKFSDYLSILALLISSTSLFISVLNYRRQGGILKFALNYEQRGVSGIFLLRVENKGFHSIKINQIRMLVRERVYTVDQDGFELEYGKQQTVKISLAGYKDFHPLEVSRIEVVDIADNVYKISTKPIRRKIYS
ncbi:MAG: hypothetical protein QM730_27080 [Anaerolineales bacterium]